MHIVCWWMFCSGVWLPLWQHWFCKPRTSGWCQWQWHWVLVWHSQWPSLCWTHPGWLSLYIYLLTYWFFVKYVFWLHFTNVSLMSLQWCYFCKFYCIFFDTLVQTYYMSIAESIKHWPGVCVSACPVTWSVWYCPTSSNEWGKWHIASLVIVWSKPAHSQRTFPCFHLSANSLHGKLLELRNEHEPALLQKNKLLKVGLSLQKSVPSDVGVKH